MKSSAGTQYKEVTEKHRKAKEIISQFLFLDHPHLFVLLHRKFYYLENFHYLGKLVLFKERHVDNAHFSNMIINQDATALTFKENFLINLIKQNLAAFIIP